MHLRRGDIAQGADNATMKLLVTFKTDTLYLAEYPRRIFALSDGTYRDPDGCRYPKSSTFAADPTQEEADARAAREQAAYRAYLAEVSDGLEAFDGRRSPAEPHVYGFRLPNGTMAVDPQYRAVGQFVGGLCPVCIGMTHYRSPDGSEHYEEHWGYINQCGQTAIRPAYSHAGSFNRFGAAVVECGSDSYLIDRSGCRIPGTEGFSICGQLNYHDRFVEVMLQGSRPVGGINQKGLFDTRDHRMVCPPEYDSLIEWDEDTVVVCQKDENNPAICRKWYMNSRGEYKFPWHVEQNGIQVDAPDEWGNSRMTSVRFLPADPGVENFYQSPDGARYVRVVNFGLNAPDGTPAIPCAYDRIYPLGYGLYAAVLSGAGTVTVFG